MKSFRFFRTSMYESMYEDMTNPRDVARQSTKDLEPMFVWLNTQQSGKKLVKTDKKWAKTRELVGIEIAKRAKKGDKQAKAAFKHMERSKLHHKGQTQFGEETINEWDSKYIVAKSPDDNKWYAMGHVGNNKWMPVSDGFKSKAQAQKWAKIQSKVVNPAAKKEIGGAGIDRNIGEATSVGKGKVPVYAEIKGKKGYYKVIGHVSKRASSIGAAKVGKEHGAVAAQRATGLVSDKLPEGPGWVILAQSGPGAKAITIDEAVMINYSAQDKRGLNDLKGAEKIASSLAAFLKKGKVKFKQSGSYITFDADSYHNSPLAKKKNLLDLTKQEKAKGGRVTYSERDPMGRKKRFESYAINEDIKINFLGGIDPKLQAILDKYPKEYARVMAGAELSDRRNVRFFDAAYEYFYDQDPMAAKRQSEDTEEFVYDALMNIGDGHSQRWGVVYARDLVKELKKAKVKHKTDKRYKVEVDIQSYNNSALADKKSIGEFIADMQKKNATVDFTER